MKELFKKVQAIVNETDDFHVFEEKYGENLRFSGEKMFDGATFVFDLDNGYSLIIAFSEYHFESFSIIHKSLNGDMLVYL